MTIHLADGNVLIALAVTDHVHHEPALAWFEEDADRQLATCPITQGTFVRFLIREGLDAPSTAEALDQIALQPWHVFWPDEVEYSSTMLTGVIGHRQVTDAYLVGLARHFGGRVATLDKGLAVLHADAVTLVET